MQFMEGHGDRELFTVREMPHFSPYIQFLINIAEIHFEHVRQGRDDYNISGVLDRDQLKLIAEYLTRLEPGAPVSVTASFASQLYPLFVVVSRLLICDYGEAICIRLTRKLPPAHRWHIYETFRNDLLRHNAQMLLDFDANVVREIAGFSRIRAGLDAIRL